MKWVKVMQLAEGVQGGGIAKAKEKLLVVVGLIMGGTRGGMLLKQKKIKPLCAGDGMG